MDNKEPIESVMFEEKIFNDRIIDSSTFDVITSSGTPEKRIKNSHEKEPVSLKNISRFVEMPLQISSSISKSKTKQPFLSIEDKGYKNENFRNYEISLIDEKNEKKIKCYRRFSNFDSLNQKLKEKFPFLIIPFLPKKNYKVKILKVEEQFYSNRTRRLKSYLNYIFRHEILANSVEFSKFLNDADFVKNHLI